MNDSGSECRRIYLDAIEQATRVPNARGTLRRNLAEDVLVRQLKQAEKIRFRLDKQMRRAIKDNEDWVPDVDFVTSSAKNTDAIAKALSALRAIRKDGKDARKGLTDEQLDAVFVHQLNRIASGLSSEQWRTLLAHGFGTDVADAVLKGRDG